MSRKTEPVVSVVVEELVDPLFVEEYDTSAVARGCGGCCDVCSEGTSSETA
jgi:hypothetical protein